MYACLIGYTIVVAWALHTYSDRLHSPEFQERAGMLLNGIDVQRGKYSKYYTVVFLVRRILFVTVPLLLFSVPSLQIMALLYQ